MPIPVRMHKRPQTAFTEQLSVTPVCSCVTEALPPSRPCVDIQNQNVGAHP